MAETVLRLVQEALTNAARHGNAGTVWLTINEEDSRLRIDIHDDGQRAERIREGNGIAGMRRHAADRMGAGMSGAAIRVALADDQALVRAGLRALLQGLGVEVVLEAEDGQALLDALLTQPVDVVLSDIRMPGLDGIEALRQLRARGDATPLLLLTTFDESDLLLRASEAGAQGFLLKDAAPADLREAIERVAAGETLLMPVSTEPVRARYRFHDEAPPSDTFGEREAR
ncbi:hypothetical protein G6F22_016281 [Rhizopus arrhizus]|nr:hypothetical protein G6F22_016281 [Rhizopus arrhizus]